MITEINGYIQKHKALKNDLVIILSCICIHISDGRTYPGVVNL